MNGYRIGNMTVIPPRPPMASYGLSWDQLKGDWTAGWNYLWNEAQSQYSSLVAKNPEAYKPKVEQFVLELAATRGMLDQMKPLLGTPAGRSYTARYNHLARQHYEMSQRFASDVQPVTVGGAFGFVPIMVVLGAIAVGLAAAAWAVAAWEFAKGLREQTALAAHELDERVLASKEGRTLQASTLPAMTSASDLMAAGSKLIIGGLVLLAGVMLYPHLQRRS